MMGMALVRRWWLRRISYRPNYAGYVRNVSPIALPWHFGLCLNDYVLYSILWTFGPIRTIVEADLVLGLFFRHAGARSSYWLRPIGCGPGPGSWPQPQGVENVSRLFPDH